MFDPKAGLGAVPWNQEVDYMGFTLGLTPEEFRMLALPLSGGEHDSTPFLRDALRTGRRVGNPFLSVDWDAEMLRWLVGGHEGRHRMRALDELDPKSAYPVHMFPRGMRARDVEPKMREAPIVSESGLYLLRKKGGLACLPRSR